MLLSKIKLGNLFLLTLNRISLVASGFFELRKILMAQFLDTRLVLWLKASTLTTPRLLVQLSSLLLFAMFFVLPSHKIGVFDNLM